MAGDEEQKPGLDVAKMLVNSYLPVCMKCRQGQLVPLSDYSQDGQGRHTAMMFKGWCCTNPKCNYNIKIKSGEIVAGEPITSRETRGASGSPERPASHNPTRSSR